MLGTVIASYYRVNLMAFAATILLSALLMLIHRKSVSVGFRMLKNFQRGGNTSDVAEA